MRASALNLSVVILEKSESTTFHFAFNDRRKYNLPLTVWQGGWLADWLIESNWHWHQLCITWVFVRYSAEMKKVLGPKAWRYLEKQLITPTIPKGACNSRSDQRQIWNVTLGDKIPFSASRLNTFISDSACVRKIHCSTCWIFSLSEGVLIQNAFRMSICRQCALCSGAAHL